MAPATSPQIGRLLLSRQYWVINAVPRRLKCRSIKYWQDPEMIMYQNDSFITRYMSTGGTILWAFRVVVGKQMDQCINEPQLSRFVHRHDNIVSITFDICISEFVFNTNFANMTSADRSMLSYWLQRAVLVDGIPSKIKHDDLTVTKWSQ